ncbi:MAG: DUF4148 domain-containing protein, partial [Rhizobacter sp.]|nr:DUF4148 domain-containing protein [Rhizobacter sp.]
MRISASPAARDQTSRGAKDFKVVIERFASCASTASIFDPVMRQSHHRIRKAPNVHRHQESIMNRKQLIGLTALALAMGSAFADEGLTRTQVREDVIAARKAGELVPAGQGVTPGYPKAAERTSSVS